MTSYGTVTDYTTGQPIRPATAAEWRKTADVIAGGRPEGIFPDEDGTAVYVDGGPEAEVSDTDIAGLEQEAASAGDSEQVRLCQTALGTDGVEDGDPARETARAECVKVILSTRIEMAA